ncbi:MAG: ABC transporter ATP-binding protein [Myxococcales bacterium]|nr:ABC transporter ATP-binding protein [Myxococcales bacterium]
MIETRDLRVDYGDVTAVRGLNLSIPKGEIFGLIGPNGAGKTSTIRVLATLQEPTYGDVFVGGVDAALNPTGVHELLGYMPDFAPIYDNLKVWEFLDLFAAAYALPRATRKQRVDESIQLANLEGKRDTLCEGLSRGMRQRLVLAKTLLHEPKVLLLDEPASGLDPMARIELRRMLIKLVETGKTVLVSSHILTELADFCTSMGIMEKGKMVVQGKISEIIAQMSGHKSLVVEVLERVDEAHALIRNFNGVRACSVEKRELRADFDGDEAAVAELLRALVQQGIPVIAFHEEKMDVEDVFLKVGAKEVS